MFTLPFNIPYSPDKIHLGNSIVSIGSCFADSMGSKLIENKFNTLSNPFGTIFNPHSIAQLITNDLDEKWVVENKGVYYHWQAHGQVSALSKEELLTKFRNKKQTLQAQLASANWLIITLGSAFAYRLKSNDQIVANCHKVPQSEFSKELLSIDEITQSINQAISSALANNPNFKVILTVSPVRHLKDGLVENNRSKARLIEAMQDLSWKSDSIKYFPAYEIMMDELRDYRFFAKDRVHPSEEAIEYIWKRFAETYFDKDTIEFIEKWKQITNAINHRPFHVESEDHQKFLQNTILRISRLQDKVDMTDELSLLQRQLLK